MTTISNKLDPNRLPKEPFGLKAESSLNKITLHPSLANPEEKYVYISKLSQNVVIISGSVKLRFDLNVGGHANNTVVNNISRNLITRMKISFGGETIRDLQRYDLLKTYKDLYLPTEERKVVLAYGILSTNVRKMRTSAGDKDTSAAKEVFLAAIHNTKY